MEKTFATFEFSDKYRDQGKALQTATVRLKVDYKLKTFAVTPSGGTIKFDFTGDSHNSEMWLTVAKLIQQAIEFGQVEVGQKQNPKLA